TASGAAFSYRPGRSVFHRFPAGLKLLGLFAFSAVAFASVHGTAFAALLLVALCIAARIPPGGLLKGSRPLMVMALVIVLVKTVEPGNPGVAVPGTAALGFALRVPAVNAAGFLAGLAIVFRILVIFAAAAFLFAVTTMRELRLSIAALETRLKTVFCAGRKRQDIAFFSLGISLMLGFIPRFFEMWETANLACRGRSCRPGLRWLLLLIPLVTERMMEAAAETVLALEARGLGNGSPQDGVLRNRVGEQKRGADK
ncbi:MAG: hypothetical protein FWD88_06995, partial [Treponema sp.]|nr:hypothetical protein [Treponema sp.]